MINGKEVKTFESDNGFLAISLPEMSSSEASVEYVGTNLMTVSKIISVITLISIILFIVFTKHKSRIKNIFAIFKRKW